MVVLCPHNSIIPRFGHNELCYFHSVNILFYIRSAKAVKLYVLSTMLFSHKSYEPSNITLYKNIQII